MISLTIMERDYQWREQLPLKMALLRRKGLALLNLFKVRIQIFKTFLRFLCSQGDKTLENKITTRNIACKRGNSFLLIA